MHSSFPNWVYMTCASYPPRAPVFFLWCKCLHVCSLVFRSRVAAGQNQSQFPSSTTRLLDRLPSLDRGERLGGSPICDWLMRQVFAIRELHLVRPVLPCYALCAAGRCPLIRIPSPVFSRAPWSALHREPDVGLDSVVGGPTHNKTPTMP